MIKVAVLITEMENGKLNCVPEVSLSSLFETAKEVRSTGTLDGKTVKQGIILCSWKSGILHKFRCESAEQKKVRELAEAEAKKEAKAKAEAESKIEKAADAKAEAEAKVIANAKAKEKLEAEAKAKEVEKMFAARKANN